MDWIANYIYYNYDYSKRNLPISKSNQHWYDEFYCQNNIFSNIHLGYMYTTQLNIVFLTKIIMSEIVYVHETNQQQSPDQYAFLSIFSKYVLVVDISSVFFLQTVLVLVCYNWANDIVKQLLILEQIDPQSKNVTQDKFLAKQKLFRRLLKLYLIFRSFFFLIIIPFIVVTQPSAQNNIAKIMLLLLLIETVLVLIALGLGVALIKKNKKLNQLVNLRQIDIMRNRYLILIICTILRLILDFIFIFINFEKLCDNTQCFIDNIKPKDKARITIDFILSNLITHCLLIYIVLRIYNIPEVNLDTSQSLLVSESYASAYESQQQNKEGQVSS